MIDGRHFERFHTAEATITRPGGAHGPDGFQPGPASEILVTKADMQKDGKVLQQHAAGYENGNAMLFCREDVTPVEVGDTVEITEGGRTTSGAVEGIIYDNNALVLDL